MSLPIVTEVINAVVPSLENLIPNEVERKKVENELEIALASNLSQIAVVEAQGESWMQRNWRPFFSMTIIFAFIYGLIILPLLSATTGYQLWFDKSLFVDTAAWWLTIYGGGHTLKYGFEKVSEAWQNKGASTVATSVTQITNPAAKTVKRP